MKIDLLSRFSAGLALQWLWVLVQPEAAVANANVSSCFNEGTVISPSDDLYARLRPAFSKLYDNWPYLIIEALPLQQGAFVPATEEQMETGKGAVARTVECCRQHKVKFTARCGGHNNAGASVLNGLLTLDVRGLNRIEPTFFHNSNAAANSVDTRFWSPGTVKVGAGATAGQSQYVTFTDTSGAVVEDPSLDVAGGLPVGQKPSVGMSGLTMGGGFGFQTRYAGLLCDRLVSFEAVVPNTNEAITVTKDGEYADLFWAACGGGGGNFVVVTDFTFSMMPVCPYYPDANHTQYGSCHGVVELQYFVPLEVDIIDFYQDWSQRMDTRITPNFEVVNNIHGVVAGIYMGPLRSFFDGLMASGITNSTPLTMQGFEEGAKEVPNFAQAITDLSGWTDNDDPSVLVDNFLNERTYFKYKSFWLLKKLPREAIEILIANNNVTDANNSLVFEFQALGGGPTEPYNPLDPFSSPPNNFSSVHPKDTAFAHRGARHCLMLKATGETLESGERILQEMESVYEMLTPLVAGQAVYYNHMDISLPPGDDPYFKNGVTIDDRVGEDESNYWVDRLAAIRRQYNPDSLLSNLRPCCGDAATIVDLDDDDDEPGSDSASFNTVYVGLVSSLCALVLLI